MQTLRNVLYWFRIGFMLNKRKKNEISAVFGIVAGGIMVISGFIVILLVLVQRKFWNMVLQLVRLSNFKTQLMQ